MKKPLLTRRHNAIFSSTTLSLGALAVLVIVVILLLRIFLPEMFASITTPLFRAGAALTSYTNDIRATFTETAQLLAERDGLREQNAALFRENTALKATVEDFAGFAPDTSGIIAGILSRPPLSPYDTLVVAAGTNAGVAPGMRVFAPGGVPIGTVISTLSSSATVTLYSSPGTTLSAWVGDDRVPVTLTGEGGGAFSATAPKSAGILEGDIVYVVGTITAPLGVIKDITTNASSPSVELFVAPSVNLFSLVWVTVVP